MSAFIQPIRFAYSAGGWEDAYTQNFPEDDSASFLLGNPVVFEAGSGGSVDQIASVGSDKVVGIALNKFTGTAGTPSAPNAAILVVPTVVVLSITVDDVLSNSNAPGTKKPTDFTIGATYSIDLDGASGLYYLVLSGGTAQCTLIGYDPSQASVINGRVYVRWLQSQTVWT